MILYLPGTILYLRGQECEIIFVPALRLLLWGQPGVGVFLKPDCSVEMKGLVDFDRVSNGIESSVCTRSQYPSS